MSTYLFLTIYTCYFMISRNFSFIHELNTVIPTWTYPQYDSLYSVRLWPLIMHYREYTPKKKFLVNCFCLTSYHQRSQSPQPFYLSTNGFPCLKFIFWLFKNTILHVVPLTSITVTEYMNFKRLFPLKFVRVVFFIHFTIYTIDWTNTINKMSHMYTVK